MKDFEKTRKVPSTRVDRVLLGILDQVVRETLLSLESPGSMSVVARLIQAVQEAYQGISFKPKPKSTWQADIEAKIASLSASKDLLPRAKGATA